MEKIKISIIVPVYNVEKYLEKCINSILTQTYQNLEIILVDDGSMDNSGEICDEYAKKDERIKVIHKENGGLSDARNAGIEIATGKYIGFVDSDDYIGKDMYEYLIRLIQKENADISICGHKIVFQKEENNEIKGEILDEEIEIWDTKKAIVELLKQEKIHDYAWNKLYKKELFEKIRYPKGRKMEDLGTTYKLFDHSKVIVLGNQKKYFYLQREGSIVNQKSLDLYIDKFELTVERYQYLKVKYPDLIENDIDMLDKILRLCQIDNKEIEQYIEKNHVMKLYYQIIKDKKSLKSKMTFKMKMKILILRISRGIYKKI